MAQRMHIVVVGNPASSQLMLEGPDMHVEVVETLQQVKHQAQKGHIDGLVFTENVSREGLRELHQILDVSKTLILSGPCSLPEAVDGMKWLLSEGHREKADRGMQEFQTLTLEDYVESKVGEFVRAMKASSARGLHATLLHAVERPLIQHALRETNGNQIQAAQLLGMNRNTLRKKIVEYHIPVKRRSRRPRES